MVEPTTDLTIKIRNVDMPTLEELATREWRETDQQVSAMVEAVLRAKKARADRPRAARRTTSTARAA